MKLYFAIKYHEDGKNKELIKSIIDFAKIENVELINFFIHFENEGEKTFNPKELMEKTFKAIDDCDGTLIDLSEKGVGVGIEAGYSFAKNKPIFVIAKNDSDISNTLKGISKKVLVYNSINDLKSFFREISI